MSGIAATSPHGRVFISYAHDNLEHKDRVHQLWCFLRERGIDARADFTAAEQRQDWPRWMLQQIRSARFVLIIASPEYRRRAEGYAAATEGRGVQWEAGLIQEEMYADQTGLNRFLPVVLPGCSTTDIPHWLRPASTTYYVVSEYTDTGAEKLLRLLTDQPYEMEPPLGAVPTLPRRTNLPQAGTAQEAMRMLLGRLANRALARNDAMVEADVRQLLLIGGLGLGEHDLGIEPGTRAESRRRIEIDRGFTVIEVRRDLRTGGVAKAGEQQLAGLCPGPTSMCGWGGSGFVRCRRLRPSLGAGPFAVPRFNRLGGWWSVRPCRPEPW